MSTKSSKTKSLAKKKAWKYFSQYIRQKEADHRGLVQCVTCSKWMHWKKAHAGHFISRRYASTLFDEKNVSCQCAACNTFNQGRQYEFGLKIDEKYGEGTAEKLLLKSKMFSKRTQFDFECIAELYKEKIEQLENNH